MFYKASVYISDILEQQNKFNSEDKEIYRFGIQQSLNILLNILTTVIIGVSFGVILQSILFLICYMPLRSFCGGYHAKTHIRCYIYSVVMITCILLFIKLFAFRMLWYEISVLISLLIIFLLAPVEDRNKPLNHNEKKAFRRKACFIAFLEGVIYHISFAVNLTDLCKILSVSLFSLSVLMIIGWFRNYSHKSNQ